MERTVYMVSKIQNGYIDGHTYKVFVDYKRAVTEFKSLLGEVMLESFRENPTDGNIWDVLKIPLDSQEFKNTRGGCIIVWLSDEDYFQLRAIEEVS